MADELCAILLKYIKLKKNDSNWIDLITCKVISIVNQDYKHMFNNVLPQSVIDEKCSY